MNVKLFDSELKIMDVLRKEGDSTAKHISDILKEETGWNVITTYTLIKRCIKKGAIERSEPDFMCHALISREDVQAAETEGLKGRFLFCGRWHFFVCCSPFPFLLVFQCIPWQGKMRLSGKIRQKWRKPCFATAHYLAGGSGFL